ncbi:MAG: DUF411 domain-containing protein [Patescibacteria group bacterium]
MKQKIILSLIVIGIGVIVIIINLITSSNQSIAKNDSEVIISEKPMVTVYKSPSCGCCVGYISHLKQNGYEVDVIEVDDMSTIKEQYNIPQSMESCHTSIFGEYVVEGHMPLEAVEKLLKEKPEIDGIALPNMPAGTPGMPGIQKAPYIIYSLDDDVATQFMEL